MSTKRRNTLDSSAERLRPDNESANPSATNSTPTDAHPFVRRASESASMHTPGSRVLNLGATPQSESDNTVFLGESNLLTTISNAAVRSPSASALTPGQATTAVDKSALCYPISEDISSRAARIAASATSKAAGIDYVTSQGAFRFPEQRHCDAILHSYFSWFHPCFPIVERAETSSLYIENSLSPLLFQAILFVGSTYAPSHVIQQLGFGDRHRAKAAFYQRAKLLYDIGWEENKIVVVQALFLMSFWRAGPENEKDTRHWLGAAISLAQTRGFHRLTRSNNVDVKHTRLRRKIWWSLYVRDRQCNASLGLPSHIRDEDCDVAMLDHADFLEAQCEMPEVFGSTSAEHEAYAIQMARLVVLLGKIVNTEFAPRGLDSSSSSLDSQRNRLKDQLTSWKSGLPHEIQNGASDNPGNLWSNMLPLAYNHNLILLHRSSFTTSSSFTSPVIHTATFDHHPSLHAATTISRLIEDMLSHNNLRHSQIHLITSFFSALCIHVTYLRSSPSNSHARKLAEQRAQVCILGLKELQRSWDVNNWVLQLFFGFLDEGTRKRLNAGDFEVEGRGEASSRRRRMNDGAAASEVEMTRRERNEEKVTLTPRSASDQDHDQEMDVDFAMKMSGAMGEGNHHHHHGLRSPGVNGLGAELSSLSQTHLQHDQTSPSSPQHVRQGSSSGLGSGLGLGLGPGLGFGIGTDQGDSWNSTLNSFGADMFDFGFPAGMMGGAAWEGYEDFGQYFVGMVGSAASRGGSVSDGVEGRGGFDARGLDFLGRCL